MQLKDVTYRHIAIMLCKALPVNGEAFAEAVNNHLEAINKLPKSAKVALRSAYIFSRKVPKVEREDLFQEIALTLLKSRVNDEKLAYSIARCDWMDWWKKYRIRQHYSLDSVVDDGEGNEVTLAETLVGETEFELKMNGKLDAQRIWDKLPAQIKEIVQKRLLGQALKNTERARLSYFVKTQGVSLLLAE